MKNLPLRPLLFIFLAAAASAPAAPKWPAFDRAEFAHTTSQIEPDADAEILLHERVIDDSSVEQTVISHFYRIHVYTERGVDRLSKVELFHDRDTSLIDIEARTLHPDGTVTELGRKDIYSREVLRSGSTRRYVKSFAPPALAPGVVVEYRFEERKSTKTPFFPLLFQPDFPARLVRYRFHPINLPMIMPGFQLRCLSFNCPNVKLETDSQGFYPFEAKDVHAFKIEPMRPRMIQSAMAVFLYYSLDAPRTPAAYWKQESRKLHERMDSTTKVTGAVKSVLAGIIAPGDTDADKLRKIHDYCRSRIVNRNRDTAGYTSEQRRKLRVNKGAADTLKHGSGTSSNIVTAFVTLARAAGFEARLALANDRNGVFYMPNLLEPFIFNNIVAAVRLGDTWSYYDPGATYLPAGMIDWKFCGTSALIADPGQGLIERVDSAAAAASLARHEASLTLDESGALEGDVTSTYTGYFEATRKNSLDAATAEERKKFVTDEVQKTLKLAEVSDVQIDNAADPLAPLKVRYHLRVPDYAERTGSRLFVQPAVFRKGIPPLFQAATRTTSVLFDHHYAESDDVTITLPEGFDLEAGNAPDDLSLGQMGEYQVTLTLTKSSRQLSYQRKFALHANSVPVNFYPALKQVFDELSARDNHVLTLKRTEVTTGTAPRPETPAAPAETGGATP